MFVKLIFRLYISNPNRKNKVKIPEPCEELGIKYCNTIEMFRKLGETF